MNINFENRKSSGNGEKQEKKSKIIFVSTKNDKILRLNEVSHTKAAGILSIHLRMNLKS